MTLPEINSGEYLVIKVDGTETLVKQKPSVDAICKAIGCEYIDTVKLKRKPVIVMIVDDMGMLDNKPVNPKATALYHSVCKPGTVFSIHGDVAIVHDGDFA